MVESLAEHMPYWAAVLLAAVISASVLIGFVGGSAFLYIWAERKVSGRIQDRLGPTRVGPIGILQSLADGIKLITKEDTVPDGADKLLFRVAPYLAFCASFTAFLVLPFGHQLVAVELPTAAFFLLAVLSVEVFGVMLAGYSSGSKWAMFGGIREAAQVVSYEVPRSLCVVVPVCVMGTLSLNKMAEQQGEWFWNWTVFHDPFNLLAFVIFFITATASCKRAPFDLAEAESELVAGFHTEYSGFRWSVFFLAEYGSMFAVSGLACLLFLGGWHTGFLPFEPTEQFGVWGGNLLNAAVFIGKGTVLVLVMMWVRWSLPRLRIDQVMTTCLKYFLPIACVLLVGVCAWQLWLQPYIGGVTKYVLGFGSLLFGVGVFGAALFGKGAPHGSGEGVWTSPVPRTAQPPVVSQTPLG
jgi:NADH-quinone oxidoreductase subunit H